LLEGAAMPRRLFAAAFTALLLPVLGACGSVTTLDDAACPRVETTATIVLPIDTGAVDVSVRGSCLDVAPTIDDTGRVDCFVIAARTVENGSSCDGAQGLIGVAPEHEDALDHLLATYDAKSNGWNTVCEVVQLDPASAAAATCRTNDLAVVADDNGHRLNGFCYVDATTAPPTGNPDVVKGCSVDGRRAIRFLGAGATEAAPYSQSLTVVCAHQGCSAP
jgi:hypothetical protein